MNKSGLLLVLLLAGAATLSGCSGPSERTVRLGGASTAYPLVLACADEYRARDRRACVAVTVCGTRGGFDRFVAGQLDVATASRPVSRREIDQAARHGVAFVELPVAFDPLTVVVHPDNDWVDHLTTDELARIWGRGAQGRVTRWSQVRPGWPDLPLRLFGPGPDSGTFDYFTGAVVGSPGDSRTDYSASEDDNTLVRGVAGDRLALGYFGHAYFVANKARLRAVPIKGPNNPEPVAPGAATASDGSYAPLSRPLFVYVNAASAERPEVDRFVSFLLDNASALARRKAYAALPEAANVAVRARYRERVTGTVFGGEPAVGLTMNEVVRREMR